VKTTYTPGTAIRYSHSVTQIEKKGAAYGIEAEAVDGMNLMAVIDADTAVQK
jgi:TPP-dependent pyruvate/acetoin dehydrogenase alpha subunit